MGVDPESEIERFLRTGESDPLFNAWQEEHLLHRARRGDGELRMALVSEVRRRTTEAIEPEALAGLNVEDLTRTKVAPMVRGLFPGREQDPVLSLLERSVVFLTPANITDVLGGTSYLSTAWELANLYLASCGADLLSDDAPRIVGLSNEATCYVSMESFRSTDRFADFIVHESAHVFHNCKRGAVGLRETRSREWLLPIDFKKRETFAYACEAFSRILELGPGPADRRLLLAELEQEPFPGIDDVLADEFIDILREAVLARNGWKRILERCSMPPASRSLTSGGAI
jgi:hypothetical protein